MLFKNKYCSLLCRYDENGCLLRQMQFQKCCLDMGQFVVYNLKAIRITNHEVSASVRLEFCYTNKRSLFLLRGSNTIILSWEKTVIPVKNRVNN